MSRADAAQHADGAVQSADMQRAQAAKRACSITLADGPCPRPAEPGAPLELCTRHLLEAHDWVARGVGVTDLLPGPCLVCGSPDGVEYPSGRVCAVCEWRVGDVPDLTVADPRIDVVYYLRYRDQIKIGTSANPRMRVASLPHDEVLAFELGDRLVERRRHEQFAAHRFAGTEWFAVHDALLAHVTELRLGVRDPWAQYDRWVSRRLAAQG